MTGFRRWKLFGSWKNTARDELYLKLAEDFLYGEFAAALDVEKDEVEDLIGRRVREMEMCL